MDDKQRNHWQIGRMGPASNSWKGGKTRDSNGYVVVTARDHPWPRKGTQVLEHVLVMELHIGRRIAEDECVHHIDGDKLNNALDNLQLMDRSAHSRLHSEAAFGDECKRGGHVLTPDNVYVRPNGARECRECRRQRDRHNRRAAK